LLLKLPVTPFCQGLPGSINAVPMLCATIHEAPCFDEFPDSVHRRQSQTQRQSVDTNSIGAHKRVGEQKST